MICYGWEKWYHFYQWLTDSEFLGVAYNYETRIFKAYDSYIDEVGKFDKGDVSGISFHLFTIMSLPLVVHKLVP